MHNCINQFITNVAESIMVSVEGDFQTEAQYRD